MTKFIILLLCFTVATSQRSGNSISKGYSQNEIQRQNRITQRIIANFLERRLFPFRRPQNDVPTIDEILPTPTKDPPKSKYGEIGGGGGRARKRFRPNLTFDLLKGVGGGHKTSFRPSNPKYSALTNSSDHSIGSEEEEEAKEDYYDENEDGDDAIQEDLNYDNYDEPEDEGQADNSTTDILTRDHVGGAVGLLGSNPDVIGALGDYDDAESLQTVESEHFNLFYRNHNKRYNGGGHRFYFDDELYEDCPNCVDDQQVPNRWTMPVTKLGDKRYYLGVFFKANWYRAAQYCRFHGMHLASISSQEENDRLEKHVRDFGFGNEHFWTSGTDLADEGNFFWMATGRPITFTNWNAGEPNNFRYENGEEENCMELWNRDGKGLKWNDSPCSFETYFVCEVQ